LILSAEDVRVVLGEGAGPHQAVQRARRLVAMAGPELAIAQRQVAVRAHPLVEDLDMAGAAHRLQREGARAVGELKHVRAELLQVPAALPQRP
jgi:hypothetical protein